MPRAADLPLPKKESRFITFYVAMGINRTIERAAELAGFKASHGKTLYRKPEVRAEIDRQLKIVEEQMLGLIAKDEAEQVQEEVKQDLLEEDFLDGALRKLIELDPKEHGRLALDALKTGYVRKGIIQMGNASAVQAPQSPSQQTAPGFYTASFVPLQQANHSLPAPLPPPDSKEEILDAEVVEPEEESAPAEEQRVWSY